MPLDRSRPYAEILCGLPYPVYEQDGRRYTHLGRPLDPEPETPAERDDAEEVPLERRSGQHIRRLVEAYGGTFTTKEEGIRFLRGAQ